MFGVQQAWRAESCRQKQTNPTFAVEAWKVLSKTSDSVQNMMHLVYTDSTWFTVTCDDVTAPLSQRSMLAIHRFFQKTCVFLTFQERTLQHEPLYVSCYIGHLKFLIFHVNLKAHQHFLKLMFFSHFLRPSTPSVLGTFLTQNPPFYQIEHGRNMFAKNNM